MTLEYIYTTFKSLATNSDKIDFLNLLKSQNLPYSINYDNLIKYYQNNG